MVYFSSSIENHKETRMFKTRLISLAASLAIAVAANAQYVPGAPVPGSLAEANLRSGLYQQQVYATRAAYFYETGYDGFAPSWQNPNAWYVPVGGGVLNYGYLQTLQTVPINESGMVYAPAPIGGGCFPGAGGGFNNMGWGVGVNAGVGGNFGGGNGGGGNYDYNNTSWGIGINGGVGGNSGSWGGGGFDNLGWGVGINGGIGGNSGSFRSW
jgi:hypothetical protein